MKLYEYQSREIFAQCDIPVPRGGVAFTLQEVRNIAKGLGGPVIIKTQRLDDLPYDRSRAILASDVNDAWLHAEEIFSHHTSNLGVQKVLVEEAMDVKQEFYLTISLDRSLGQSVLTAATRAVDPAKSEANTQQDMLVQLPIDPIFGLMGFQARNLAFDLGLRGELLDAFVNIANGLHKAYLETDARLAEINSLIITSDYELIATSPRIELDDNALYRHANLADKRVFQEGSEAERLAYQAGLSYIKLVGNIGCIVNGAGLAMATLDMIKHYGGRGANFLDIGGGAGAYKVTAALRILLNDPEINVILFNIFGGITRCDEVAIGILDALAEVKAEIPLVVRLAGTREKEGHTMLANAQLPCTRSLSEAIQTAISLAKGERVAWAF